MTIQNTTIRKAGPSQGNGVTTVFPFTFKVFTATDILVTYLDALAVESVLVLSTNYTVSLNADQNASPGGSVTLLVAPATATYITLTSQVTNTQNLSLTNSGGFYPQSINDALDRTVIQVQQLAESVSRAATAPVSGIGAQNPANLVFGVNALGVPILSVLANIALTAVSTFMSSLLGLTSATAVKTALSVQTDLQTQANTSALTTGTSTAYIATPLPTIATPVANTRLRVKFHLASGVTPTLQVGSVTAALQQYDETGTLLSATLGLGHLTDVEYNGSVYVVLDPLPITQPKQMQPITASVGASALTCTLNPTTLNFRNTPLTSGTINIRTVATAISVVVPSTATLGTVSAQQSRLVLLALDNAGTVELAVVNIAGGTNLDETTLISTTAISAAATSASVVYSTTARTSLPFRVVGYIESTQATAGTWATAPSTIQGQGGQALAAMSSLGYGQTWQVVTGSRAQTTTYYNTTGKPIFITIFTYTAGGTSTLLVNGVVINTVSIGLYGYNNLIGIIPPNASYSATTLVAVFIWTELR